MVRKNLIVAAAIAAAFATAGTAKATTLLNSFENSLGAFSYPAGGDTDFAINGYSTTTGVTNGTYSAIFSPTSSDTNGSGPTYNQFLSTSGYSTSLLATLSNSTAVTLDVFAPTGSFNGYIQFQAAIQTNDPAFTYAEIGGFDAAHTPVFGTQSTITFTIPASLQATLQTDAAAGEGANFSISIGGGYTAGNETAYLDNLVADTPAAATPEPASLGLIGITAGGLLARRRRHA